MENEQQGWKSWGACRAYREGWGAGLERRQDRERKRVYWECLLGVRYGRVELTDTVCIREGGGM